MGTADRVIRAVVGLGMLSLTVVGPQTWWGLLGVIPLATAAAGYCPLYAPFGLSTARRAQARGR